MKPKILSIEDMWGLADKLYVNSLAEQLQRQQGWIIIMGHGICREAIEMIEYFPRHVPVDVFRDQMTYLLSHGYTFITMTEGMERLRSGRSMKKLVTLTFDDGFRNVLDLAYPVMQELELKGCLYVITDYANTDRLLWTDMVDLLCWYHRGTGSIQVTFPDRVFNFPLENKKSTFSAISSIKRHFRRLPESQRQEYFKQVEERFAEVPKEFIPSDFYFASWEELRGLDPQVLEIGSHTASHPNLANVDEPARLRREVFDSKANLERELGRTIEHFCYPAGSYNPAVLEQVRKAGYASGVTLIRGVNDGMVSALELMRLNQPATLPQFKARISGLETAVRNLRRMVGQVPPPEAKAAVY
jgi:peptidoglycan/xylan/chitin deacetylase (PgdA/CDA1 family)